MIEFKFDKKQADKIYSKLCEIKPRSRTNVLGKYFTNLCRETEVTMKEEILSGQVLKVRTGALRRSIGYITKDTRDGFQGLVGSGVRYGNRLPYATIHETGGVITPKKGKYLAIPLPAALTKSGSQLRGGAFGARDFKDTFFMRSKKGNLLIMQKKGKHSAVPLFVLKKSVTIPARRYMSKTVDLIKPRSEALMDATIKKWKEKKA
jgi:phage gpG-like protein